MFKFGMWREFMMLILNMVYIKFNFLTNSIKFDDVIILKTMKTEGCQYLDKTVMYAYEAENWHVDVIYDADLDYGIQF